MKPGDMVRIYSPGTTLHGSIGLVTGIDKANNHSYHKSYYVLTPHGTHSSFPCANLIESTDDYFRNDWICTWPI